MTQAICDITTDEVNVDVVVEPQADTMVEVANRAGGMEQVFHDNTLIGNGNSVDLGVNTDIIATKEYSDEQDTLLRNEINGKLTAIDSQIDANADAIQKTREDYISADSEIHQILNNHTSELTTLRGNQASLGDQVSGIEEKIPESASGSNPLITKQQLLDEEMDIRDDLNEMASELQTQITAQAAEITTKQDQLTAGDNIIISGNIISATGAGGGAGFDIVVVQELPATGQKGIIYLLAKDGAAPDVYDEYVWVVATQTFELIGTTQVDLSNYLPLSGGTIKGVLKIQSGQGTGSLWVGADTNGTTLTNNTRHLARIVVPSYSNVARGATLLGWDSSGDSDLPIANRTADVVGFGGSKKISNATSPMGISFCVTKVRESTAASDKIYALAMDANESTFGVPVFAPDLTVGTSEGTLNIGVTAGVATIATNNGLDIVAQTKFDTAPTTDDSTTYANALDTSLMRKAQVATAISDALSSFEGGTKVIFREWE